MIIPARNRAADLGRCLTALAHQDFPRARFEVLVCDDGSQEDLRPAVRAFQSEGLDIRLLRQDPKGPAAARNLGIRGARAEVIAMTDSDTLPDSRWLSALHAALQSAPHAVAVEGCVRAGADDDDGPLAEGPSNLNGGVFLTCNCAYRRDVLWRIGGFDEAFPYPAYEDTELAARASEIGPILWQPEAVVIHQKRPTSLADGTEKIAALEICPDHGMSLWLPGLEAVSGAISASARGRAGHRRSAFIQVEGSQPMDRPTPRSGSKTCDLRRARSRGRPADRRARNSGRRPRMPGSEKLSERRAIAHTGAHRQRHPCH